MGNERGSDKSMLRQSLYGPGFFVCFCHNTSKLDCFVAHVSAESHCAPLDVPSVHPPTALTNEHSCLPNPFLLSPFFPLSALLSK